MIYILNEFGSYSLWTIYEEEKTYYKICLTENKSIITTISKNKCYLNEDEVLVSDIKRKTKISDNKAFASFVTITLD